MVIVIVAVVAVHVPALLGSLRTCGRFSVVVVVKEDDNDDDTDDKFAEMILFLTVEEDGTAAVVQT